MQEDRGTHHEIIVYSFGPWRWRGGCGAPCAFMGIAAELPVHAPLIRVAESLAAVITRFIHCAEALAVEAVPLQRAHEIVVYWAALVWADLTSGGAGPKFGLQHATSPRSMYSRRVVNKNICAEAE